MVQIPLEIERTKEVEEEKENDSSPQVERGRERKIIQSITMFFNVRNELGELSFYRESS